jgi:hypothetical protein
MLTFIQNLICLGLQQMITFALQHSADTIEDTYLKKPEP